MSIQPALPADLVAAQAKLDAKLAVRRRFSELRIKASELLQEAEKIASLGGLSDIEVQQARAAARLTGAHFYSLPLSPDEADFERLRDDLFHVARSVDPLILAIGEDAKINSHSISAAELRECFADVILGAVEGNATFHLEECARAVREDRDHPEDEIADRKIKSLQDAG